MNFRSTKHACYTGYITQAIVVNLAPLLFVIFQNTFSVSLAFLAFLTLITFLIQIAIDLWAVKYVERISFRKLAVSSQLFSALGLVLLSFLPLIINAEVGLCISALVYSSGSALSEVVLSPLVESLPDEDEGGSSMALLHSFYSWGHTLVIVLTTVVLKIVGDELWFILPLLWALIPIYNGIRFMKVPMVSMLHHDENTGMRSLVKYKAFALAIILMICSGAAEQVMAQWASYYAEVGLGVSKVMGDLFGPCIFALMMAAGRTAYGLFGDRMNLGTALTGCATLTVVCYIVAVFFPSPIVSLLACGLTGLGVSLMWPGMLSLCADKYSGCGASMFAMLAVGGDIGCSVGPFLSGTVSDIIEHSSGVGRFAALFSIDVQQFSIKAGILSGVIFPLVMIIGVILLNRKTKIK